MATCGTCTHDVFCSSSFSKTRTHARACVYTAHTHTGSWHAWRPCIRVCRRPRSGDWCSPASGPCLGRTCPTSTGACACVLVWAGRRRVSTCTSNLQHTFHVYTCTVRLRFQSRPVHPTNHFPAHRLLACPPHSRTHPPAARWPLPAGRTTPPADPPPPPWCSGCSSCCARSRTPRRQ